MGARPSSFVLTTPGKVRLYSTRELIQLPPPMWLIDGIMPADGLIGLYGAPGSGKSFVAIDMALSIATGQEWMSHGVEPGFVLYIGAEGGRGIVKRVKAWIHAHQCSPQKTDIAWMVENFYLRSDSEDMETLLSRINDEIEVQPSLIVVDTLARCFQGDENLQEDMNRFVQGADLLRQEFGSTVLVVHHTRLDGDRERGSTAFRGAADAMILVEKYHNKITLTNDKQKDSVEFKPMKLILKPVAEEKSCVVVRSGLEGRPVTKRTVGFELALEQVLNNPWLKTTNAKAISLARLTGKDKETCRTILRRHTVA